MIAVTVLTALTNKNWQNWRYGNSLPKNGSVNWGEFTAYIPIVNTNKTEIPRRTQVEVLHFGIVWALQDYLLRAEQAAAGPLWS